MKRSLLCTSLTALGLFVSPGVADTIELTGVVRDFTDAHPDMNYADKSFGVRTGLVLSQLGEDGKPVLDTSGNYANGMITGPDSFNQWYRDTVGVNISIPYAITLDNGQEEPGGVYSFSREKPNYFFPIDGMGWNDSDRAADGLNHNFYFTYELHTQFTYSDPNERDHEMVFSFTGDDDVWVYINGKLACDIGGVHGQAHASVNLDDDAEELGLEPGGTYTLDFFFAERHVTQSNFRMETTIELEEIQPTTTNALYD